MFADGASLAGPLINLGAIGVCLVALSFYYLRKDKKYEERIDERLKSEETHRKEVADLTEKYRMALEKFGQTLDVLRVMLSAKGGGGA